jgi:hypothetical protein
MKLLQVKCGAPYSLSRVGALGCSYNLYLFGFIAQSGGSLIVIFPSWG